MEPKKDFFEKSSVRNPPLGPWGEPLPWDSQRASQLIVQPLIAISRLCPLSPSLSPPPHPPLRPFLSILSSLFLRALAPQVSLASSVLLESLREIMLFIGKPMGRSIMISSHCHTVPWKNHTSFLTSLFERISTSNGCLWPRPSSYEQTQLVVSVVIHLTKIGES